MMAAASAQVSQSAEATSFPLTQHLLAKFLFTSPTMHDERQAARMAASSLSANAVVRDRDRLGLASANVMVACARVY